MMLRTGVGCGLIGAAIGVLAAVVGIVVAAWAVFDPLGNPLTKVLDPGVETKDLPGDARAFDPLAAYDAVAAYAGDGAQLTELSISLVRRDGTLDLKADYSPQPDVTYEFVRQVSRPDNAPPPGVSGATGTTWYEPVTIRAYEPGQRRQRTTISDGKGVTVQYRNKGLERTTSEPTNADPGIVPRPACSIPALWDIAITKGAPADGVARITYDHEGYRFSVTGFVQMQFNGNCQLRE